MLSADALLFDFDGVLVDSRVPFARSVNAALAAHGLPTRPEAELHRHIGPPLQATFLELGADGEAQSCVEAYRARYREFGLQETVVFDGIPQLLDELAGRVPLVVATSKVRALAEPLLVALGLRGYFEAVCGPDLTAVHEPKSVTIARALEHLPHARRPVMVGDRKFDVIGAQSHGLSTVGVLWGIGTREELLEAGADALISTPAELPARVGLARAPA